MFLTCLHPGSFPPILLARGQPRKLSGLGSIDTHGERLTPLSAPQRWVTRLQGAFRSLLTLEKVGTTGLA